jgi:hypothetical protein
LSPHDRQRQRIVALLLVPAAVAVTAALLLLRLHFQPPTVPAYTLAPLASDAGAAGAAVVEVHPGGRFSIELRPSQPVVGAVAARGFLLRGDDVRPWDPPFEVARDGTVRLAGPVDVLFAGVPAGEWEVAVAVGRPENLPTAPRDVLRARDEDAGTSVWHLVRERIRLG